MHKQMFGFLLFAMIPIFISAQNNSAELKNNLSLNLLALPVSNGVISYERVFSKQSVWLGIEHHFNALNKDQKKSLNSFALEYRRYLTGKKPGASGLFAGLYSKYRWGEETVPGNEENFHRYNAVFAGLNAGYQLHINRLVLSGFAGYGIPVYMNEKSSPVDNPENLNEGFKRDLRLGLTVGFAF
jgi:hypothetical protein